VVMGALGVPYGHVRFVPAESDPPVEPPTPSDGPHLMYAIQWFGFATITAAGAFLFLRSRRRDERERSD